jgi:hypothetical protein
MFPAALVNMVLTAGVVALAGPAEAVIGRPETGPLTAALLAVGVIQIAAIDWILTRRKNRRLASRGAET